MACRAAVVGVRAGMAVKVAPAEVWADEEALAGARAALVAVGVAVEREAQAAARVRAAGFGGRKVVSRVETDA